MHTFTFSSELQVSVDDLLRTFTMSAVNAELRPLVRMTAPKSWASRSILEWPERQALFQSWILLFGVVPIDRHSFYFEIINPAEGFVESSSSTANSVWRHQRTVAPIRSGCRLTDTIHYQNRAPLLGALFKPLYGLVFFCRHRYLRTKYAGRAS